MIIDLSQYQPTVRSRLKNGTYGDEPTVRNAKPAVVYAFSSYSQRTADIDLPEDLSSPQLEALLDRIQALATQI
jgi:hypothetical protein